MHDEVHAAMVTRAIDVDLAVVRQSSLVVWLVSVLRAAADVVCRERKTAPDV